MGTLGCVVVALGQVALSLIADVCFARSRILCCCVEVAALACRVERALLPAVVMRRSVRWWRSWRWWNGPRGAEMHLSSAHCAPVPSRLPSCECAPRRLARVPRGCGSSPLRWWFVAVWYYVSVALMHVVCCCHHRRPHRHLLVLVMG